MEHVDLHNSAMLDNMPDSGAVDLNGNAAYVRVCNDITSTVATYNIYPELNEEEGPTPICVTYPAELRTQKISQGNYALWFCGNTESPYTVSVNIPTSGNIPGYYCQQGGTSFDMSPSLGTRFSCDVTCDSSYQTEVSCVKGYQCPSELKDSHKAHKSKH